MKSICLLFLYVVYLIIGAKVFQMLEQPAEVDSRYSVGCIVNTLLILFFNLALNFWENQNFPKNLNFRSFGLVGVSQQKSKFFRIGSACGNKLVFELCEVKIYLFHT